MDGKKIGSNPTSQAFCIWWDADFTRELVNGSKIDKYKVGTIFNAQQRDGTVNRRSMPDLTADLFGDWREEIVFSSGDTKEMRIYTTTIPTEHRLYTLMHDPQYRLSIAWQNVAYNQPPHLSFYLGEDMKKVPRPNIILTKSTNTEVKK
jgi:rhamnogalacturonan endolyase